MKSPSISPLILAAGLLACGSSNPCTAGASAACSCTNGQSGAQMCQANGTFAACTCAGSSSSGSSGTSNTGATTSGGSGGATGSSSGAGTGAGTGTSSGTSGAGSSTGRSTGMSSGASSGGSSSGGSTTSSHGTASGGSTSGSTGAGGGSSTGGTTGAATANFYVYQNGVINPLWQKDYSFGTFTEGFMDTTDPESGDTYDFSFSTTDGAGWQPVTTYYAGLNTVGVAPFGWDISPYTYMTIDLYPASASDPYDMQWHYVGDIDGTTTDTNASAYIPSITEWAEPVVANQWNTGLKIPLAAVGQLGNPSVYKFFFRDNNGGTSDIYLDNVGFVPGTFAWVYSGGAGPVSGWADASSGATANYAFLPTNYSSALVSLNGLVSPGTSAVSTNAIQLSVTAANGELKITNSAGFSVAAYDHLTFGAVPTQSGYAYSVQLYDTAGAAVGTAVNPAAYTGYDQGVSTSLWTTYCIPLSAFGSIGSSIGGLAIQDKSGKATNTTYFSAIGFYE
jgi:hypothetical protein